MASFRVIFPDGSVAKRKKVVISVSGGGMAEGFTDSQGYVSISTSNTSGKVIIDGRTCHEGSLNVGEVVIR